MITRGNMQLNLRILKLVNKLESEQGFTKEEDEKELYKALKELGLTYIWSNDIYNPEIIIFRANEQNLNRSTLKSERGWKADIWGVRR